MSSIAFDRDLVVRMRDGVRLFANLFRPAVAGRYPVIMSVTPYGKDNFRIAWQPSSCAFPA
jgi:predicted acyl esterase